MQLAGIDDRVILCIGGLLGGIGGFIIGCMFTLVVWKTKVIPKEDKDSQDTP